MVFAACDTLKILMEDIIYLLVSPLGSKYMVGILLTPSMTWTSGTYFRHITWVSSKHTSPGQKVMKY